MAGGDSNGIVYFWSLKKNILENQLEFKKVKITKIKFIKNTSNILIVFDSEGSIYFVEIIQKISQQKKQNLRRTNISILYKIKLESSLKKYKDLNFY